MFSTTQAFPRKRYLLDLSNCDGFDMLPKNLFFDEGRRFLKVPCRSLILGSFFSKKRVLDLSLRSLGRVPTVRLSEIVLRKPFIFVQVEALSWSFKGQRVCQGSELDRPMDPPIEPDTDPVP